MNLKLLVGGPSQQQLVPQPCLHNLEIRAPLRNMLVVMGKRSDLELPYKL